MYFTRRGNGSILNFTYLRNVNFDVAIFCSFLFFLKIPQLLLTVKTVSKGIVLETEKKLIISYSPQHMLNPKFTETIRRRGDFTDTVFEFGITDLRYK